MFDGPLEQSVGDTRQHQLIKLPNNMVVLCTSDPDSAKAAASLSVNVGSMADPKEFPGMAHFLEHMLFMGSAKYPTENEYTEYIANNLGKYNAYTANTETTFYFSIANPAFEGALDRFSRFFIDPLLSADGVDREVNAVDSEFKGYLQSDGWRLKQLMRSVTNPTHPYNHFNIGNLDTLKVAAHTMGKNLHKEVKMFYQQYYSADIMKLAIAGNHSIEQLVEWTVEKFSKVESKGNTKLKYEGHPLDHHALGKLVHMETIGNINEIAAYFKMLVVGNFAPAEAVDAAQQVNQMLKSQPLPAHSHMASRMVNIEPGHYIYRHMGEDPNMLNNAVVATFYCGMVTNPKDRTTMALLVQIVKDQFFGQIRTKEQLGYRVGAFTNSFSSGKLILELRVQGESNPTYLLQRIDSFIQGFRQTLAKFDTIKFDALVGSIVGKANEKVMSVDAKANRMWTPIDKGTYNFAQLADEVVSLQRVRLDDVLDMWDRYINPQTAVTYIRVDSQLWAAKASYPSATDMTTWPESILALAGCLESETHMPVDLSDLSHFINTAVRQTSADALALLAHQYPMANSTQVLDETASGWSKIKNALDMATNPHVNHVVQDSETNFAYIGMYQTVEGKWVITDVDKFKATQALFEMPVPVIKLIPNTLTK
ncbi:metalloprotease [Coemansia sp. D1744]|nr:metalloprotease [Coemansia sp. D1744]